jgi:ribosomal protein L37AE/L43A
MRCVLCSDRVAVRPATCDPCRSWLPRMIGDLRILAEQLATPEPPVRDVRVTPVRDPDAPAYALRDEAGRLVLRWRDPVAHAHPAGPVPGLNPQPRVSASHEAPVPINVGAVDLMLAPRRGAEIQPPLRLDPDAPLVVALEAWVDDWRWVRDAGERQPTPAVPTLTWWLAERVEWACDAYYGLAPFAESVRRYRTALRRALGLNDRPEYKAGVACPKCSQRTLWRRNGETWITCASCATMLSPDEYATQVTSLHRASTRGTF